jgi:glycosyltransferase involved in cell wall biosynthesis
VSLVSSLSVPGRNGQGPSAGAVHGVLPLPERPLRIAFVSETWLPSTDGVVTRLVATVRHLRALGHEVLMVAPGPAEPTFEGTPVLTVPTVSISFIAGGRPWGLPLPRVASYLDAFRPDIVHVVNPFVIGVAGVIAARRRRWPLVCSYHTNVAAYARFYHMGFSHPAIWTLLRLLHNAADLNFATSDAVREDILRHGIERVDLWERAVDTELFHPARRDEAMRQRLSGRAPGAPVAVYVGRLAPEKGLDRLRALTAPSLPLNLAFVGDGPYRAHMERDFRGTGAVFTGMLQGEELAKAYASADLFLFPSTTDTLGLVVLEALSSGLPVVAADSAPSREMLLGTNAARLFQADNPESLRSTVESLVAPGAQRLRQSLSDNARAEAEQHDWRAATERLVAAYSGVLAMRRA